MAESSPDKPNDGVHVELIPRIEDGMVDAALHVYDGGKLVASQHTEKAEDVYFAALWIAHDASEKNRLPLTFIDVRDADGMCDSALGELLAYGVPALRNLEHLAQDYLIRGTLDEKTYYANADRIYRTFDGLEAMGLCSVNLRYEVDERFASIWNRLLEQRAEQERSREVRANAGISAAKKAQEGTSREAEPKQGKTSKR